MKFNPHYNLAGKHAFLAPSNYAWIRYTPEHLAKRLHTAEAAARGSALHQLAHDCIKMGIRLQGNKTTMARYVNEAIGFRMSPEQVLYFSENCFGTADALSFRVERGETLPTLRVFDLKTGESKVSVDQLLIYCAIFCLEYDYKPFEMLYDLRIYQSDEVQMFEVDPKDIVAIMDTIRMFDKLINELKAEEA